MHDDALHALIDTEELRCVAQEPGGALRDLHRSSKLESNVDVCPLLESSVERRCRLKAAARSAKSKLEDDGDDDRYSASIERAGDERPFPSCAERLIIEA